MVDGTVQSHPSDVDGGQRQVNAISNGRLAVSRARCNHSTGQAKTPNSLCSPPFNPCKHGHFRRYQVYSSSDQARSPCFHTTAAKSHLSAGILRRHLTWVANAFEAQSARRSAGVPDASRPKSHARSATPATGRPTAIATDLCVLKHSPRSLCYSTSRLLAHHTQTSSRLLSSPRGERPRGPPIGLQDRIWLPSSRFGHILVATHQIEFTGLMLHQDQIRG